MDIIQKILIVLVAAAITAYIGYIRGQLATIREKKIILYQKTLPWLVNAALGSKHPADYLTRQFNSKLRDIWILGDKNVAKTIDDLCSVLVDQNREISKGTRIQILQKIFHAMRKDVQIGICQDINPNDIKHIHMIFNKTELQKDEGIDANLD